MVASTLRSPKATFAVVSAAIFFATAPALAGPPFRTDDPETVEYQHWEVYGFSTGTHVRDDTSAILPGVEVNYGAAPNLQLHAIIGMAFDKPTGGGSQYGFADTELGFKYRFIQEDEAGWRPQVGIFPLVVLPTGDAERGLGNGHTQVFLPLWVQKSFGDWTTYGGGGYRVNPGAGKKDFWFTGWLLQRKITEKLTLGGEIFHQTADVSGGQDSTGFNFGGYYDFTENHHLLFSAGRGLQNATDTNEFSYYIAYQLTF